MRKKQKGGVVALSVILASSLSAPSIAMAAETTAPETSQVEISAEVDTAAAEQPAAPVTNEQPAASASSEQPVAPASSEQPTAPVSEPVSNQQAVDLSTGNADANDTESSAKTSSDVDSSNSGNSSDASNSSEPAEKDTLSSEQSKEAGNNTGEDQKAPQQEAQNGIEEPAVDSKTTAPNNVNTEVSDDDKQGSDISYKANATIWGMEFPVADSTATIKPEDANSVKTLGDVSKDFKGTKFGEVKAGDLVVKGDMSIEGDTAKDAAHDVEKDSKHDVKADLDVSAIHTAIEKSASMLSDTYGGENAAKAVYVNFLETGLRSTFKFGNGLNGEFYVPVSLEDAQAHYILSSADGSPMIFRINYSTSTFTKDEVKILMDLDLTHMKELNTTYDGSSKVLYGENGVKENFNHTDDEYGSTYDTSTFGNFKQLITSSAKKISLVLKDVLFHSATGNSKTTENDKETTTTTQGSIDGTLVGYMKANVGHNRVKGNVSYVWGAMQDADGKDVNATDDHVMLTAQFTETTPKNQPETPDTPSTPDTPTTPDTPSTPDTPNAPSTPSTSSTSDTVSTLTTPSTPDTPSTPSVKKRSTTHKKVNQPENVVTESKMPESPATGDTSNLYLWFLSMIASFGVCVTSLIHFGKKKSSRFHD
ncbi:MAG: hypothetical protein MR596_11345 [Lachnospiraceae bacterium]|uniref:hypothetical protein n=1 Tax=Porcincola intestinalis TaxID=2606632 RepID=UPI00197BD427|nr:hypothetical protein [Porcincola intestinalis]MCI6768365.1 hypothetical protein [Lachnospiraceae bacterium]